MIILLLYTTIFAMLPMAMIIDMGCTGRRLFIQKTLLIHQAFCLIGMIGLNIYIRWDLIKSLLG